MSDDATDHDDSGAPAPPPARVTRHVQPLGPRVLVRIEDSPDRLESGLYLPATAKDHQAEALLGQVVEVARTQARTSAPLDDEEDGSDEDGPRADLGANVSGVPLGAKVLFGKERGIRVPWDDSLRLVEVRHILAIVDEIPEEELQ